MQCRSATEIASGALIIDVCHLVNATAGPRFIGLGANCIDPSLAVGVVSLLRTHLRTGCDVLVYPNKGEVGACCCCCCFVVAVVVFDAAAAVVVDDDDDFIVDAAAVVIVAVVVVVVVVVVAAFAPATPLSSCLPGMGCWS